MGADEPGAGGGPDARRPLCLSRVWPLRKRPASSTDPIARGGRSDAGPPLVPLHLVLQPGARYRVGREEPFAEHGPLFEDRSLSGHHFTIAATDAGATVTVSYRDGRAEAERYVKVGAAVHRGRAPLAVAPGDVLRAGNSLFVLHRLPVHEPADTLSGRLVGHGPAAAALRADVRRFARSDQNVLVLGETGTGKEVVMRALHDLSGRSGAYVALDCTNLPDALVESEIHGHRRNAFTGAREDRKGLFQAAEQGTLAMDEVGDLTSDHQAKFLRVIQEREVRPVGSNTPVQLRDVRIVAATDKDLAAMVGEGGFREQLFHRLNVLAIAIPPLRERREDIPALVRHFIEGLGGAAAAGHAPLALSPACLERLLLYDWPGNVRELQSVVARAIESGPRRPAPTGGAIWIDLDAQSDEQLACPPGQPTAPLRPPAAAVASAAAVARGAVEADVARPTTREELAELLAACGMNMAEVQRRCGGANKARLAVQCGFDPEQPLKELRTLAERLLADREAGGSDGS